MQVSKELLPILQQLIDEGYTVYSYAPYYGDEINSLYWYEGERVLNIQPSTWRNARYARDRFEIGVSYKPSYENGCGCGLSPHEDGTIAADLLRYRFKPTWVRGVKNYDSIKQNIRDNAPLEFHKLNKRGEFV
jgi:hypothetical protein